MEKPVRAAWNSLASRPLRLAVLYAALVVLYHSNLRPMAGGDSLPATLIPLSVILDRSITLDRYGPWLYSTTPYARFVKYVIIERNGHYYSLYPVAQSVLATPLYVPPALGLRVWHWDTGSQVLFARIYEKFAAVFLTALSVIFMLLLLEHITRPPWTWILTVLYAVGTNTWSTSSQALWQHTSGELLVVAAMYGLVRWWQRQEAGGWLWLASACAGMAILVRPTNVAFAAAAAAALAVAGRWASGFRFGLLPGLGAVAFAGYNLAIFGTPFGLLYREPMRGDLLAGLAGVLFSPGRGLILYSPVLLFALSALFLHHPYADSMRRFLLVFCAAFVASHLLLVAKWPAWWGGYCWGPRLLTEIVPPLIVLIALGTEGFARVRPLLALFVVFAVLSVLTQMVGVYFYPRGHWDGTPVSVDLKPARLWDWCDNPVSRSLAGGFVWEPYALIYKGIVKGPAAAREQIKSIRW